MNPQPSDLVSSFFSFIFICTFLFYFFTLSHKKLSDNFTIGYYDPPNFQPVNLQVRNVTNITKQKESPNKILMQDCANALHSLGYSKGNAKTLTQEIFKKHNPKTVQEFISIVFEK